MVRGVVMTARGHSLNMEELILAAKRPMSMKGVDHKNKVAPVKVPAKQLNVRGFVPSAAGVTHTIKIDHDTDDTVAREEGPSLADLTAVNLKAPKRLKERPGDASHVANAALSEIIGDLEKFKGRESMNQPNKNGS